jgi:hypothetical protein
MWKMYHFQANKEKYTISSTICPVSRGNSFIEGA